MNMVSLLALGLVLRYNIIAPRQLLEHMAHARIIGVIVVLVSGAAIGWAVWQSKREAGDYEEMEKDEADRSPSTGRVKASRYSWHEL